MKLYIIIKGERKMFKVSKNTIFIITVFVLSLVAVVLVLLHSFGYAVDAESLLQMRFSAVGIISVLVALYTYLLFTVE
jgi:hypothetical protein